MPHIQCAHHQQDDQNSEGGEVELSRHGRAVHKNKPAILELKGPPCRRGPRSTMKYRFLALSFAAACVVPSFLAASGQSKPTDVYVSVVDGRGNPAKGLATTDFQVGEDGVAREVLKAAPATAPLAVALLVDDSQASGAATQMIREAVEGFITALSGKGEMSVVTYGERPTIVVDYTTDRKRLLDGAGRIFPRTGAGGYLMDAIVEVSKGMQKRHPARPVIAVLMLDNEIEFSNR